GTAKGRVSCFDQTSVQKYDLLVLGPSCSRVSIQTQALERVIEKRLPDRDLGFPAAHSVVESDNPLLCIGQLRMRPDLQRDFLVPIGIATWLDPTGFGTTHV